MFRRFGDQLEDAEEDLEPEAFVVEEIAEEDDRAGFPRRADRRDRSAPGPPQAPGGRHAGRRRSTGGMLAPSGHPDRLVGGILAVGVEQHARPAGSIEQAFPSAPRCRACGRGSRADRPRREFLRQSRSRTSTTGGTGGAASMAGTASRGRNAGSQGSSSGGGGGASVAASSAFGERPSAGGSAPGPLSRSSGSSAAGGFGRAFSTFSASSAAGSRSGQSSPPAPLTSEPAHRQRQFCDALGLAADGDPIALPSARGAVSASPFTSVSLVAPATGEATHCRRQSRSSTHWRLSQNSPSGPNCRTRRLAEFGADADPQRAAVRAQ